MQKKVDRREFLISTGLLAGTGIVTCNSSTKADESIKKEASAKKAQNFIAGFAPLAGMQSTEEMFWQACDECARLGFHHVETDNTRLQIVKAYADRPSKFKEQMDKRNLTMLGFAQFSAMSDPGRRDQVIEQNMRIGRFLQAVGGRYITHLFEPRPNPKVPPDKIFRSMTDEDFKFFASTANELGKRLREETGIRIAYHAEGEEVKAGILHRIMEMTNPDYFDFWPDTGHLAAGGSNPLKVYKTYRSRMIGSHFKDYDPNIEWQEPSGQRRKGRFVPLGKGIVDFPPLVAYLKESGFTGQIMGELDGQPESTKAMRDYMVEVLHLRI
jgi:sugar phosphate isomerase/epimerase